jgi:transposase
MKYIQGESREQSVMFPEAMDDYIGENNAVRVIDVYIETPMYSPQDMLKLYIYGYMNRIRSSRRLETESKRNIELIWLLKKLSPDHKTIARFRQENSKQLKNLFRNFVKLCIKLGLYGKELVAIDGSKFKAVNSRERNFNDKKLKERIRRIEETQKSLTDPDSRRMMANGRLDVCYNIQTAVDGKNGLIAEFEVTNQANDKGLLCVMAVAAKELLDVDAITATADKGYESATDIADCIKENITPQVAMEHESINICVETEENVDKPEKHINGRCIYDKERNIGICPMGEILRPSTYHKRRKTIIFANRKACRSCYCKCTIENFKKFEITAKKGDFKREYDDTNLKLKQIEIKPDKNIIKKR